MKLFSLQGRIQERAEWPAAHWPSHKGAPEICIILFNDIYTLLKLSLAPLSRFRGSHITTAHEQHCCRFQSYAKSVPSPMKLTSEIHKA